MRRDPVILSWSAVDRNERNLFELALAMGTSPKTIIASKGEFWEGLSFDEKCVLTTSRTLMGILQSGVPRELLQGAFINKLDFLFVLGFCGCPGEELLLDALTDGALSPPVPLLSQDGRYEIDSKSRDLCSCLSGLTFGPVSQKADHTFVVNNDEDRLAEHIKIDGRPFFVEMKAGPCRLFLLACTTVIDIDMPAPPDFSLSQCFSHIIPEIMFFRRAYDSYCWHATERLGCFIIDDPGLREKYGFFRYRPLLEAMDKVDFSTSVAFIPWNYRRTVPSIARLFKERSDRLSLSIHGCNHTEREYGSADRADLLLRTQVASRRMEEHRKVTGVEHDRVMVFPMGCFSMEALKVLKSCGFLGAVNSTARAVDGSHPFSVRDFFEAPALEMEGFPLFLRRYPEDISEFALDIFIGKPVLVVEHHGYFKNGPGKLADFMARLNQLAPDIRWCGLGAIIMGAHLVKICDANTVQVKFFSGVLRLHNESEQSLRYILKKRESGDMQTVRVIRNGISIPFEFKGDGIVVEFDLPGGADTEIRLEYAGSCPEAVGEIPWRERCRTWFRRHLTELRDNHLSRSEFLVRIAQRIKNEFYRT